MTISEYPKDNYQAFTCDKHTLAEIILDAHNGDYVCYEGTLVDNFIMTDPQPFDITNVKDLASTDWDDDIKEFFVEQSYEYLVVLERYQNCWTSVSELIYTNDHEWVATIENMLMDEQQKAEDLATVF